jgi:hypothetical protein
MRLALARLSHNRFPFIARLSAELAASGLANICGRVAGRDRMPQCREQPLADAGLVKGKT